VGGGPRRSRGSLAFATALLDLPRTPSRTRRRGGLRGPSERSRPRTFVRDRCALLTLMPSFPALPGPCRPVLRPGFLSWGCPKIAPSSSSSRGVHSRSRLSPAPSGKRVPPPLPRSVPVVSHHLDGFLLPRLCRSIATRCRSWGSPRFLSPRSEISRDVVPALRSLALRRQRRIVRADPVDTRASRHHRAHRCARRSPRGLALSPFAAEPPRDRNRASSRRRGPRAFLRRRSRGPRSCFQARRPVAPLGLPGLPGHVRITATTRPLSRGPRTSLRRERAASPRSRRGTAERAARTRRAGVARLGTGRGQRRLLVRTR
jgi:hypothetical protein